MEYVILLISLAGIVFGADFLVNGAVVVARRCKVSSFVIGAVIVGIGTSLPELVVSSVGAIEGNSEVAIGNVVGSNIFNVFAILGFTALLFPVAVPKSNLKFELPYCIGVSALLGLLVYNFFTGGTPLISRIDGAILLVLFALFMFLSLRSGKKSAAPVVQIDPDGVQGAEASNGTENAGEAQAIDTTDASEGKKDSLVKAVLSIVLGLAALVVISNFFVDEAVAIAKMLGVSDAFISITLLACGTSLPELAASITAAVKKDTDMALGNIIGSNIFNITAILGVASMITPLTTGKIGPVDYSVMLASALIPLLFGLRGKISRAGGAAMLLCYAGYAYYLVKFVMAV